IVALPAGMTFGYAQADVTRLSAVAALAGAAVLAVQGLRVPMRAHAVDLAVLAFVAAAIVSALLAPHPPGAVMAAVNFVVPFAFFLAGRVLGARASERVLWTLVLAGTA